MRKLKEEFKDIIGYEGDYQVSNYGIVKSLKGKTERILKPHQNPQGYYQVSLSKDGKSSTFRIHKLVSVMFLNHTPCGYREVIDHIDGDNTNNMVIQSDKKCCSKIIHSTFNYSR